MNRAWLICAALLAGPLLADDELMEDCAAGDSRFDMQCINRNGVCVELRIDGHATRPIRRADKQRLAALPDMDDVCWQVDVPVSAGFRLEARGGGLVPAFIGELESFGLNLLAIEDFDPQFDRRIDPLHGFELDADGYRDGSWQLRPSDHFRTPGSGLLKAGEYVAVVRVHGTGNWDKQEVLIRIDPALEPSPADPGHKPAQPRLEPR